MSDEEADFIVSFAVLPYKEKILGIVKLFLLSADHNNIECDQCTDCKNCNNPYCLFQGMTGKKIKN